MFVVFDEVLNGLVWSLSCCLLDVGFRRRGALSRVVDTVSEWASSPSRTYPNVELYGHRSRRIVTIVGKTGDTVEYFSPKNQPD